MLAILIFSSKDLNAQKKVTIGEEFDSDVNVANIYQTFEKKATTNHNEPQLVYKKEFYSKNSAYIKLYFENFDLAPGDYVKITGTTSKETIIYAEKGKIVDSEKTMISDFWSRVLFDDKVVLELYATENSKTHKGFEIKKVAYGFSEEKIEEVLSENSFIQKSICSSDNKERIACYQGTEMYDKARAVCRLIIGGSSSCTGWLLGSQGHLMTNNHCIGSASSARNTDFIFNYQRANCSGNSDASRDVVASSSTFIKTNSRLDYTLVRLPSNPTGRYGYLSLSQDIPRSGDRIYIPQHAGGRRKEISVRSDRDATADGYSRVFQSSSGSGQQVRYYADTEGGSSGSPVLDFDSNLVIAIHNTGGCPNGSYGRCDNLISSIGSDMPDNGVGGGTPPPPPGDTCVTVDFEEKSVVSYSNQDNDGQFQKLDNGITLLLQNNTWKYIDFDYQITSQTVLEFDFRSTSEGEIHAIGFDNNNSQTDDRTRLFKIYGNQNYGSNNNYDDYSGTSTKTYRIPVGNFYTGSMDRMAFINDNDSGSGNTSYFSNIRVYEGSCDDSISAEDLVAELESTSAIIGIDNEPEIDHIKIMPNPATSIFSINLQGTVKDAQATIYSLLGKVHATIPLISGTNTIDTKSSNLTTGIYIVNLRIGNESTTKKLIVK